MRPTVTQLEYFVAAARCLNFRKAAAEIHATQPAVSAQIRKLEDALGVQLFERDRRKVLLTAAGQKLLPVAIELLGRFDDLGVLVGDARSGWSGPLRIGVIPTIAPHVLPRVFQTLRTAWPDAELAVREDQTDTLTRQLRDGELDVLLLAIDVELGQVETLTLFDDAFLAAVPSDHALASESEIDLASFVAESVLLLADGHCLGDQARELCRTAGASKFADFRASSLHTLMRMVAADSGVTVLPELALEDFSGIDGVTVRPFRAPVPTRRVGLAWRSGSARGEAFRELGELLERLGA